MITAVVHFKQHPRKSSKVKKSADLVTMTSGVEAEPRAVIGWLQRRREALLYL